MVPYTVIVMSLLETDQDPLAFMLRKISGQICPRLPWQVVWVEWSAHNVLWWSFLLAFSADHLWSSFKTRRKQALRIFKREPERHALTDCEVSSRTLFSWTLLTFVWAGLGVLVVLGLAATMGREVPALIHLHCLHHPADLISSLGGTVLGDHRSSESTKVTNLNLLAFVNVNWMATECATK